MSPAASEQKTCFVVMGFGTKTDFATGRNLNLDASYKAMIKPAVEACGLKCVRADEIQHSGVIDVPMYEQLFAADLVIADLSTANPNALYELGVRHALRPRSTIVMAEDRFSYPFDINHIVIRSYKHLADDIGFSEAERFRGVLETAIRSFLEQSEQKDGVQKPDSPVYTFLDRLQPPALREAVVAAVKSLESLTDTVAAAAAADARKSSQASSLSAFTDAGEQAIAAGRFGAAKEFFRAALEKIRPAQPAAAAANGPAAASLEQPFDPYLVQRLTLATYKSKLPDELTALREARGTLAQLNINDTNDPETLGLAGAIEKRLYEQAQGIEHLNLAIRYYERGYYLKDDYYNGINLAYLLDVRAASDAHVSSIEKIADHVLAGRTRREVLVLCDKASSRAAKQLEVVARVNGQAEKQNSLAAELYWIQATRTEATFGLAGLDRLRAAYAPGDRPATPDDWQHRSNEAWTEAERLALQPWMIETTRDQIAKLEALYKQQEAALGKPAGSAAPAGPA